MDDIIAIDKYNILGLGMMFGAALPLLTRNIFAAFKNKKMLHLANALHSILYLVLSFVTVFFRAYVPQDCFTYRRAQAVLFNVYVLTYEFVLAYKAKAILGRRKVIGRITVADILVVFSVLIRVATAVGTMLTTEIKYTSIHEGTCDNVFNHYWITANNLSRNFLEFTWSILFIVPIYNVLVSASHGKFYVNVNEMAYKRIFIINCAYPLVANAISTAISVYVFVIRDWDNWSHLLFGIQNFVSSYSINLILDIKVDGRGNHTEFDEDSEFSEEISVLYKGSPQETDYRKRSGRPSFINTNSIASNNRTSLLIPPPSLANVRYSSK